LNHPSAPLALLAGTPERKHRYTFTHSNTKTPSKQRPQQCSKNAEKTPIATPNTPPMGRHCAATTGNENPNAQPTSPAQDRWKTRTALCLLL